MLFLTRKYRPLLGLDITTSSVKLIELAGVDIVFGDAAGTDDGARNANHSSRSAYRVRVRRN